MLEPLINNLIAEGSTTVGIGGHDIAVVHTSQGDIGVGKTLAGSLSKSSVFNSIYNFGSVTNTGLYTEFGVFSSANTMITNTASTSPAELFYVFTITSSSSGDTAEITLSAREAINRMLRVTSQLYKDVLKTCQSVIDASDLEDTEIKENALIRLKDVLEPFGSVVDSVFRGLLEGRRSNPVAFAFLLTDLLPNLENVSKDARIAIIRSILVSAQPSARYAAMEALDILGGPQAKRVMVSYYPSEKNRMVRNLINASLSAG